VNLALLTAVKFQLVLPVRMDSCILIIILDYQYVLNLAHTVLSYIKAHKLVECMGKKNLKAEGYFNHQFAVNAVHLAMSVLDHLITSASAARKASTFCLLMYLILMVPALICL
jgi:hypothetical protein